MLHPEPRLHAEIRALADRKGFVLERVQGAARGEVDDDVGSALDFEPEREDDAFAWVGRVADGGAGADA